MSGHFDRHRQEANDLAMFAASRGMPISPERAYRAWCAHSESVAAGWLMFDLDGEEGERVLSALRHEEVGLQAADADLAWRERSDVDRLMERSDREGLGLTEHEVVRIWADHSAAMGEQWLSVRQADVDEVIGRHRGHGLRF